MSAGTAVRESIELIKQQGATPHAVVIALDRQEMATEKQNGVIQDVPYSAVQYVKTQLGLQVCSVASLEDLLSFLSSSADSTLQAHLTHVEAYRSKYGVSSL